MPAAGGRSSATPTVIAPDGIAIHAFATPPANLVGIAEGRIPPGEYSIHRHLTIEQYTYVVAGRVTAVSASDEHPAGRRVELRAGDLLLTLPGESLQFVNSSDEEARVLFICAPPYPPDDSDTRLAEEHGLPSPDEAQEAIDRLQALRADVDAQIEARVAALERLIEETDSGGLPD